MTNTTLKIAGMTCGGCVKSVTNALLAAPGVSRAVVDLATTRAEVEYDPAQTSPEQLVALIDDIGFEGSVLAGT